MGIFVAFVIALFLAGLELAIRDERAEVALDAHGIRTTAEVTSAGWEPAGRRGPLWIARYRYLADGSERRGERRFTAGIAPRGTEA